MSEQAWFWSERWQRLEHASQAAHLFAMSNLKMRD